MTWTLLNTKHLEEGEEVERIDDGMNNKFHGGPIYRFSGDS